MLFFGNRSKKTDFEAIALPHLDALYSMALRLTNRESEAEDLVQETCLKAFRFFSRFQQGTHIKAWLFKILTNTFINQYRKHQRDREIMDDWDWDHLASAEQTPNDSERQMLEHFVSKEVVASLQKIPVEFRTIVLLADLEDFAYKEIAEIMECPIGTVMSRLYRGRRMLRQLLRDFAVEQGYIAEDTPDIDPADGVADLEAYRQTQRRAS